MQPDVTIIDSGICNLFNIKQALETVGARVSISRSRKEILEAPRVVLPGVGSFGAGMKSLEGLELVSTVRDYARSGKPFLGICLGMQMLMSHSEEHGTWDGLGLIPGRVRQFQQANSSSPSYKIPQIGWNTLEPEQETWNSTMLDGIAKETSVYFVHSYIVEPESSDVILARTSYGQDNFCSVLTKDNIIACQFHPERSGPAGLQMLRNFTRIEGLRRN